MYTEQNKVQLDDYVPICGQDFCEGCGDCLHCYGGDECVHSPDGKHTWPIRFEGERQKVEDLTRRRGCGG